MTFQNVPVQQVDVVSPFWCRMLDVTRTKTIPAIVKAQREADHWTCLTWKPGHAVKPHQFWDSDIYKITEATCYILMKNEDAQLKDIVEEAVSMIENAQHPDGYINSYYTVRGIDKRWTNLRDNHELYCLGHLIEATVAYETLTKSGRLLNVAMKAIKHVDSLFGIENGKKQGYPGHQEIEIGLLRLYEMTGDPLCLKVARYFILQRGVHDENDEIYYDYEAKARGGDPYDHMGSETKAYYHEPRDYGYHQADCPIVKADAVKGHSVRAMYYYTAATDLFRLIGHEDDQVKPIEAALDRLWDDLVKGKIYVTGAIGSVRQWEGFGPAYQLPDLEEEGCYAETCATFALVNWCQRMLRLKLDSRYSDVMENGLYNGFLGAMSVEGDAFYYQNVLRTLSGKPKERSKWFGVACCPPNVAKLLANLGSLIYSYDPEANLVAVHLYIESELSVPGSDAKIVQKTNMPWDGKITISVSGSASLALRIPGWADEKDYTCSAEGQIRSGYLYIADLKDTSIELNFSLKPRKVYAHPKTGKDEVSIARGPLIYCLEDVDNSAVNLDEVALVDTDLKEANSKSIAGLDGVVTITAIAKQLENSRNTNLYNQHPWEFADTKQEVTAIPYFLRANRGGEGAMRVWTKRLS